MARSKWISFRAQEHLARATSKATNPSTALPLLSSADAKKFGLENFGNTCYANSVLQALYFCTPFRDLLLQEVDPVPSRRDPATSPVTPPTPNKSPPPLIPVRRKPERQSSISGQPSEVASGNSSQVVCPIPTSPPTLISALRSLFLHISSNPREKGTVAPRAFIDKLKELNENFRSTMHQDAHEFLNFLLNKIVEEIEEEKKQVQNVNGDDLSGSVATLASKTTPTIITTSTNSNSGTPRKDATLVHNLFEGVLTSETRCLTCETVSSRDESFLDLSIDIEQNSSVTACLRQFSASEMLCQKNKFFCDSCCDLQEAEKRMKIKKLPNVLALHLKRFKYQEDVAKYIKLTYRVAFPNELRLFNTVDDMDDADRLYNLFAIVVHVGNGPHHGHYISIIKTPGSWFVFDDDNVFPISENDIPKYFGDSNSGSAYVLYYQAVNIDLVSLGLRPLEPSPETITNLIPPVEPYPALQNQTLAPVPALPPGLNPNSTAPLESDVDYRHLPPTTSPRLPLHHSESEEASIPSISIPQSFTASPVGFKSKLINTIRRAPSASGARGTTGGSLGHVSNGGRSTVEKTLRPSLSILPSEESLQEQPPPLPPLPPSIMNRSHSPLNAAPIPNVQITDPKKEKEKDKTKSTTSGWFKKRMSVRVGEKSRLESGVLDSYPSPVIKGDERQGRTPLTGNHVSPFPISPSPNTTLTDPVGHRPDHSRSEKSERDHRNGKINGYFRKSPPEPASPFPGSSFYFIDTPSTSTHSSSHTHSRSSTLFSDVGPGPQLHSPPTRKPSLVLSSGDRYRSHVDRKSSIESKSFSPSSASSRPMTAPSSPSHRMSDYNIRSLPPLPPTPNTKSTKSHRTNLSLNNNQAFFMELQKSAEGKTKLPEIDNLSASDSNPRGIPISESPASMAASVGQNNSVGSTNSTALNIKHKLSLGFKKRDKEKDRERDRVSPNTLNRF